MKIAVCDDSREDRGALRALLEAYGHDFEIREYGSGTELYADMGYVRECGIVFLDINMEGMDGLEAAGKIKAECPKVHIVLVTAYVNYALDWYKVKASRFLLKDDLEQTLPECVEDILREERAVEFGFVEGNVRLRVDDIIYIETSKHKNVFYTVGEAYSIYKKMDELAAELAGMGFVRIHQSFLINMRYIGKLSSYVMVLTTGKEISVPKSRYPEVKRQYTLFKGGGGVIMALWIFSFCIMAIEAWGYVYFFDTFLKKKDAGRLQRCRYIVLYPAVVAFALSVKYVGSMGIKVMLAVLLLPVFCGLFYRTDWKQSIFFSMLNYSLLFLTDILLLLIENVLASKDKLCALEYDFLYIPMKMVWILLLFMIRKIWKGRSNFRELSRKEWGGMPSSTSSWCRRAGS